MQFIQLLCVSPLPLHPRTPFVLRILNIVLLRIDTQDIYVGHTRVLDTIDLPSTITFTLIFEGIFEFPE